MGIFSDVLLVSDYDDTLTQPGGLPNADGKITKMTQIPQANLDAIAAFEREGGLFTIASGRTRIYYDSVIRARITPSAPLVLANGAHIFDAKAGKDVLVRPLPDNVKLLARDVTKRFPRAALEAQRTGDMCVVHCPRGDEEYYQNLPYHVEGDIDSYPGPWIKLHFSGPHDEIAALMRYTQENYPGFECVESVPTVCEMQSRGVTKGDAARRLAKKLGRSILVCVGDAPNDLAMLQAADYGFRTGDCDPAMRRYDFRDAAPSAEGSVASVIDALRALL